MSSVPIPIREVKEPVDSGRPYLKPSRKRRREERKARKRESRNARKSQAQKKRYAKRGAVKALRGKWFLVIRVPNIIKILPKRDFKSKEGLLVKTPT